jgi:hypothetical protein
MLHLIVVCRDRRIREINAQLDQMDNRRREPASRRVSSEELLARMRIDPKKHMTERKAQ